MNLPRICRWSKFLAVVFIIALFICLGTLGLILDFVGAILLVAPAFPLYRRRAYGMLPVRTLQQVNQMEDIIQDLSSTGSVEIEENDAGYASLSAIVRAKATNNVFNKIVLETSTCHPTRHIHVTVNAASGRSIGKITSEEQDLRNLIETALERKMVAIGAAVLATGFALQIISQIIPPMDSPLRIFC